MRQSGLGYLFATQDARLSESFWRLMEAMGDLKVRLYCCSSQMLADLENGTLMVAYNVLGSYAAARVAAREDLLIAPLTDDRHLMLRTALIPKAAPNPQAGGEFIDFLVAAKTRALISRTTGLPPLDPDQLAEEPALRPITLGPALMVYLDRLKRRDFIAAWTSAIKR